MRLECLRMGRLRSGSIGASVETTRKLEHNRPDIIVLDRVARRWTFVHFSVPWDKHVVSKEDEKINNYSPLVKEIKKLHRVSAILFHWWLVVWVLCHADWSSI